MYKIILLIIFSSSSLFAAEYGTFMLVKGKVLIESLDARVVEARVDSKIQIGETVITDKDSRAKIVLLANRNVIAIAPNTKLKIEKLSESKDEKNIKLKLIEGKVRSNVIDKFDNKSSKFEIRTATAVAGVRGTEFVISFDPATKTTEVLTFRGEVFFSSLSKNSQEGIGGESVIVAKGEKSQAKEGAAASAPAKVPKKELDQADKDTNVKKDRGTNKGGADKSGPEGEGAGSIDGGSIKNPPVAEQPLNGIIKNPVPVNKSDKSKVKIITSPAN